VKKSKQDSWAVSGLERRHDGQTNQHMRDVRDGFLSLRSLIHVSHVTELPELVALPSFRLITAELLPHDGLSVVKLVFDNQHVVKSKPFCAVQSGYLLLDPAQYWTIRGGELRTEHPDSRVFTKLTVECIRTSDGWPIPKQRTEEKTYDWSSPETAKQLGAWGKFVITYDLHVPKNLPSDEEFTLSAFGLPEPPGVEWRRPTRWYLWVGAAGIAAIVLAGGFVWLRQRRRRR
jgi:hypothetical protein